MGSIGSVIRTGVRLQIISVVSVEELTLYHCPRMIFLVGDPLSMPNTNGTPTAVIGLRGMASKTEKRSTGMAVRMRVERGTLHYSGAFYEVEFDISRTKPTFRFDPETDRTPRTP